MDDQPGRDALTQEASSEKSQAGAATASQNMVRQFREILIWPLQLMPLPEGSLVRDHWETFTQSGEDNPWKEIAEGFMGDPAHSKETLYAELVYFLPYVQRFLYGEKNVSVGGSCKSPIHIFRRDDIAQVRITFRRGEQPVSFNVERIRLYFFYDIDIVILAVGIYGKDLTLDCVQDTLDRFRRVYPPYWEWRKSGEPGRTPELVEWLSCQGEVLAVSDYEKQEKYLSFVREHKTPVISSHWEYLLRPLVPADRTDQEGLIRFKLIEDERIPLMSYLAVDDPRRLTRGDFVRLGFAVRGGKPETLPYGERFLQDFEYKYCYDRFWDEAGDHSWRDTRYICCGHAFTVIGRNSDPFFTDPETGLLSHFRHQYFLLGLIVHFHKAALLLLSDRLSIAVSRLDPTDLESVKLFRRDVREDLEILLRFNHRYWFHEISNQPQARDLYKLWSEHLGNDGLFEEVRSEAQDINNYLDSAGQRRTGDTVVRLTVVTVLGLIGTVATGFLGMNLIAEAEQPLPTKIIFFLMVFILTMILTFYTLNKSRPLSEFLDAMSDERKTFKQKLTMLLRVWKIKLPGF